MVKNDEHQILQIIKFSPPIVILIASLIITLLIYTDYSRTLEVEKNQIQENFIQEQKEVIRQDINIGINYIQREYNKTNSKLKKQLKEKIIHAKFIINSIYEKNKDTKTKEEITNLIKDALREIRFNSGRGYFFINEMNGVNILHPIFPKREGKNISQEKDTNGIIRFHKVLKILQDKDFGYTTFDFFHPLDKSKQKTKIVYVEKYKPYNWVIGTGEYIKDFENDIKKDILEHLRYSKLGKDRYYTILDFEGNIISHHNNKYIGLNTFDIPHMKPNKPAFEEIKKDISEKKGYFRKFNNYRKGDVTPSPKIYFLKAFTKWDWIIATGFYENNIKELIKEKSDYIEEKYTSYLNMIILSSFIATVVLLFLSFYIAKIIEVKFINYKQRLEKKVNENIEQKNILEKAQEVANIGDWELNLKTMKATWSDQIIKIFGLKENFCDASPNFLKKIMHSEDWECFETSLQNTIKTHSEHKCVYRIFREDGSVRWIDCRGQYNKVKKTISGIVQDITDSKKLELETLHKEELLYQQSKMAAMGEMIGNIAHQWRQPLSSISTAATGIKLQKEIGILKDSDFDLAMNMINDKAQYLSQTIDDFRSFYKPNKEKNLFSIEEALEKTMSLVDAQFSSKDINIIKEIDNFDLNTLENELIQVIINILNNARDALLQNQNKDRFIFIKTSEKKDFFQITIKDNAGGIKDKIINRIFEPYFTTKHKAQGTGIGLYMSKEIVTKHLNADIDVSNEKFNYQGKYHKGAEFKIIIYKN